MAKEDKLRALDAALSSIERSFGKGAVMRSNFCSITMTLKMSILLSHLLVAALLRSLPRLSPKVLVQHLVASS